MFSFCIPRRRTKPRILSSLLILAVLLTFWLVRQEVNKTKRDVQSVIPSNLFYILSRVCNIRAELVVSNEASPCIFKCRILWILFSHWKNPPKLILMFTLETQALRSNALRTRSRNLKCRYYMPQICLFIHFRWNLFLWRLVFYFLVLYSSRI